jgi:hypothetical protein
MRISGTKRKKQEAGEDYATMSFIACTLRQK